MDFTEKTLTQKYYFQGHIMSARLDEILRADGSPATREVCEHLGGVGILPIDRNGNVILVRQYRYPFGRTLLEMPAGKLDHGPNESHYECGVRELLEETGCRAGRMIYLGEMLPSPGFLTEVAHLYCALDLEEGEMQPDEDEFLENVRIPIAELERMIADNELQDAKTIAAMYRARLKGLLD